MMPARRCLDPLTLVVKPVDACNARCVYCCADRDGSRRMSPATLEALVERVGACAPRPVTFLWHGGEPLLAGAEFYRRVLRATEELRRRSQPVRHLFQTNLLLAQGEVLDLVVALSDSGAIGTSADPLPGIRRAADGGDYVATWVDRVGEVVAAGLRVSVVHVVHGRSRGRARELYRWFRNLGVTSVRFNPVYNSAHRAVPADLALDPADWGRFLLDLRTAWDADGRGLRVEPLAEWEEAVAGRGGVPLSCAFSDACGRSQLGVDPAGGVFHCGRLADRGMEPLGDVRRQAIDELEARQRASGMAGLRRQARDRGCGACPWFTLCRGGCPDDAPASGPGPDRGWCQGHRAYFSTAYPRGAGGSDG